MKKRCKILFLSMMIALGVLYFGPVATACDIAVIAAKASSTGRPLIWKVRDNGLDWQQEVLSYSRSDNTVNPAAGGSIRAVDRTRGVPAQSGGVNEAGFAITNTTVYQPSPIHEYLSSANLNIMSVSLEECITVGDFDAYIAGWHLRGENAARIVSGNFVVIDAFGGAALYELTTGDFDTDLYAYGGRVKVHRIDANTGFVTNEDGSLIGNAGQIGTVTDYRTGGEVQVMNQDREIINNTYRLAADGSAILDNQGEIVDDGSHFPGIVNRTNSSFWIQLNDDTPREDRAAAMMEALLAQGNLNHRTMLQQVSKDVAIGEYHLETYDNLSNLDPGSATQQSTFHTISRYCTNLVFVVDGAAPGGDPRLATMWINLGEPSVGVATPYFAAANDVPDEAWADRMLFGRFPIDLSPTCMLNQVISNQRNELYENNNSGGAASLLPVELTPRLVIALMQVDWSVMNTPLEWGQVAGGLVGEFYTSYQRYVANNPGMDPNIKALMDQLFDYLLNLDWASINSAEAWSEFEGTLIEWHLAYLDYLNQTDTSDKTIDLYGLAQVQGWAVPLENEILDRTDAYLADMRTDPSRISQGNLDDFADYCAKFMYNNYRNRSATYDDWDFRNPWDSYSGWSPFDFLRRLFPWLP